MHWLVASVCTPRLYCDFPRHVHFVLLQELCVKLLTPNLHLLICRLTDQAKVIGDTVFFSELWLERMIQLVKEQLKYRGRGAPEVVITSRLEFSRCTTKFLQVSPGMADKIAEVLRLPLSGGAAFGQAATNEEEHSLSTRATNSRSYCLGKKGRAVAEDEAPYELLSKVLDVVDASGGQIEGFNVARVRALRDAGVGSMKERVRMYQRAVLRGQEVITSTRYGRSSVKDSTFVLVRYGPDPYVARVRGFVHIASGEAQVCDLHMALVDFHQWKEPVHDAQLGTVYVAMQDDWIQNERNYPVHLDAIDCKLVYTKGHIQGVGRMVFAPYTIYSGCM